MIVLVVEAVSPGLRGRLTRWLLEVHPGVFAGRVSARVREWLWTEVQHATLRSGSAVLLYSMPTEQGFAIETVGDPTRTSVDYDGLTLLRRRPPPPRDSGDDADAPSGTPKKGRRRRS